MNYIDIVLILLLVTGLVRGLMKGFIFEVAILGAFFLGMFAAFKLAYLMTPYLMKTGLSTSSSGYVSSLLMFILVMAGIYFLAKLFEGLVKIAALGIFNKIGGAIFGLIKYAFIISLVLYFFNQLDAKHQYLSPDKKAESYLYYPILKIAPALLPVLTEIKSGIEEKISQ